MYKTIDLLCHPSSPLCVCQDKSVGLAMRTVLRGLPRSASSASEYSVADGPCHAVTELLTQEDDQSYFLITGDEGGCIKR